MKPWVAAWLLLGCTACGVVPPPPVSPSAAEPLSDGATKIVAAMRARPNIDTICGGGEAFRDAMRSVVMNLVLSGEIEGNPRNDAEAAADFLHAHCHAPAGSP